MLRDWLGWLPNLIARQVVLLIWLTLQVLASKNEFFGKILSGPMGIMNCDAIHVLYSFTIPAFAAAFCKPASRVASATPSRNANSRYAAS